jgi:hypothetical protein
LNNTFLIGNNLPIGLIFLLFAVTLLINGPLCRFGSRYSLGTGDMVEAFLMVLVSCCVPSSGLLRYLPGALIFPIWQGASGGDFIEVFNRLGVADGLFPEMRSVERGSWANDR